MAEIIDFSGSDFSKTSDLEKMVNNFVTTENWSTECMERDAAGLEYVEGSEHVVTILERLIELELPFEELKKQLTGLIEERREFFKYAHGHLP